MRRWRWSPVVLLVLVLLIGPSEALIEGIGDSPGGPNGAKAGLRGYIDLVKPAISSLCNFASQDGIGSDDCKACTDSLKLLIDHLLEQRTWAVMMADALVKPPSGLLAGTFSLVSHYDQCMKIPDVDADDILDVHRKYPDIPGVIKGAYCGFKLRIRRNPKFVRPENVTLSEFQETMKQEEHKIDEVYQLQEEFPAFLGLCVPSACTKMSFDNMGRAIKSMLFKYISDNKQKFPVIIGVDTVSCRTRDDAGKIEWTFSARLIAAILIMLAVLVVIGTVVDVIFCLSMDRDALREEKDDSYRHTYDYSMQGVLAEMLRSCSAVVAFRRLMDTRVTSDAIKCLNGVKFFALVWLVMGNTGQLRAGNMTSNLKEMQKALETISTQFVLNKDLAVDSLFVVVGILFAYGLSRRNGAGHVCRYVAHRLVKTLPGYFVLVWALAKLFAATGDGPTWDIEKDRYLKNCDRSWWANIALVNNFLRVEDQCIPHSWAVAMLMQGLLVAVIATFFWKKSENVTHFVLGNLVVVTMVVDFLINFANNLGPTTLLREYRPGSRTAYMTLVGTKLYTRGGPFLIGLIIGFIFNQKMNQKKSFAKLPRLSAAGMWLMIFAVIVGTVNYTFSWNKGTSSPSPVMAALYDCFHRVVFALATGLLIMMCHAGRGGIANLVLSWPGFVPLARVWLLIYLINPFVIFHGNGTLRAPVYYTKKALIAEILWNLVMSIVVSIVLHILLVAPFQAIAQFIYTKLFEKDDQDEDSVDGSGAYPRYGKPPAPLDPEVGGGANAVAGGHSNTAHSGSVHSSPSSTSNRPEPYEQHSRNYDNDHDGGDLDATDKAKEPLLPSSTRDSLQQHSATGELYQTARVDSDLPLLEESPSAKRKLNQTP